MSENDNRKDTKEDIYAKLKARCPICMGTGFHDGKICVCITGEREGDFPDFLKDLFGIRK